MRGLLLHNLGYGTVSTQITHLREQAGYRECVEHLGGHYDGQLESEGKPYQLVRVALDEVRICRKQEGVCQTIAPTK